LDRKTMLTGASALVIATYTFVATPAAAQAPSADKAGKPAEATLTIQELVVTARKREESLQSVPVAVTAQTGEQLAQAGIREPTDLTRNVPSLTVTSSASSPTGAIISLRGQNASDILLTLSQPVGLYEDSVNIPHPAGANVAFFDLQRVEVLKGPQGTLYGRNTTGGAINIITRGADYDGVHGFAFGELGNHKDWKVAFAANVPIIQDVLAGRIAYQHWNRQGYGKSAITGQHLGGNRDDDIVRGSLRFDPTSKVSVIAKVEYVHANRTDALYQTRQFLSPLFAGAVDAEWGLEGGLGGVAPSVLVANTNASHDLFTNYANQETYEHVKAWHAVLDANWQVAENVSLRSITGFHQFRDYRVFDLDALPMQAYEVGFGVNGGKLSIGADPRTLPPDGHSKQWTQEFNLSGQAFDDRLTWLTGAFYSDDKGDQDQVATPGLEILASLPPPNGLGFPSLANFHSPNVRIRSYAVFTQNDFKLTDQFSITAGLRWTKEKLSQDVAAYLYNTTTAAVPVRYFCLAGPTLHTFQATEAGCTLSQKESSSGTSYLLSANYQVTPDILLYAKTAKGFRGGALQVRAPDFPAASPETAKDYELGLKSDLFDRRLRANLAVYQTNYTNKQETAIVVLNGVQSTPIVNAATARIKGVEGEFTAVPVAGLTLNATFDYLHGKYRRFPGAIAPSGVVDASGVSFTNPKWSYNLGARYEWALGPGEAAVQGNYAWRGKIPTTILNNDPQLAPALAAEWRKSIGLLNASVEYTLPDQGWTFSVFATNLTNKHYQTYALTLPNYAFTGITQEPRMFGVSIKKTFGSGE
jgi:iron complex outermembrane receptor protein